MTTEELPRQQGVRPITTVNDLAAVDDPFESDAEYEGFFADLYASRSSRHQVVGVTAPSEQPDSWPEDELSFAELAQRQGVKAVGSLSDLAQPGLWGPMPSTKRS